MEANSKIVTTNQEGPHPDLQELAHKFATSQWKGPIHPPTQVAFDQIRPKLEELQSQGKPWILDSGCGVGASTLKLSQLHPDHFILGVDRSEVRLSKVESTRESLEGPVESDQYQFLRAELSDLWRLLIQHQLHPQKHYILYPNPYPKKSQFKKRFHGSPSLPDILKLCPHIEVRSNWRLYLEEFFMATEVAALALELEYPLHLQTLNHPPEEAWTHFEKKYISSGQKVYSLKTKT